MTGKRNPGFNWKKKLKTLKKNWKRGVAAVLAAVMMVPAGTGEAMAANAVESGGILTISSLGYQPGAIIADDSGYIYAKDCYRYGQLYRYTPAGQLDTGWGASGKTSFYSKDRGVGLCFDSAGDLITTNYDGKIHKVDAGTGIETKSITVNYTPYCCISEGDTIYVIGQRGSKRQISSYDNELNLKNTEEFNDSASITVDDGFYGLTKVEDRIYTTQFDAYVYAYKKSGSSWVKDLSFGTDGKLKAFTTGAGGLFYNESEERIYASSENSYEEGKKGKVVSFNLDGSNMNEVLKGKKSNNLFISDSAYYVALYGESALQRYERPSVELKPDEFTVTMTGESVSAGTRDSLTVHVGTTAVTSKTYKVDVKLIDASTGAVVESTTEGGSKALGPNGVDLKITPTSNWKAGEYKVQLVISNTVGGIVVTETLNLSVTIAIGAIRLYYEGTVNGKLSKSGFVNIVPTDGGAMDTVTATPDANYEVDKANSKITDMEGNVTAAVIGVNGNQITISNISEDLRIKIAFKMNAAALQAAKKDSINALKALTEGESPYYSAEQYYGDNWTKLLGIQSKAIQKIQLAATIEEIRTLQAEAEQAMAGIPTLEKDDARNELVKELLGKLAEELRSYTESDYTFENWTMILAKKAAAETEIQKATNEIDAQSAFSSGLSDMRSIMTRKQAELETAKTAEKTKVDTYFGSLSEENYSSTAWAAIVGKKKELTDKITLATDKSEFTKVSEELKSFVGTVITKTEKEALLRELKEEFDKLKEGDYTAANYSEVETAYYSAISSINGTYLKTDAKSAKEDGIAKMKAVQTKADELVELRKTAIDSVQADYDARMNPADYTDEGKEKLKAILNQAETDIEKETDPTKLDGIVNKALADMEAVERASTIVAKAKSEAIIAINTAYNDKKSNPGQYSSDVLKKLEQAWVDGRAEVNKAQDVPAVEKAKTDAISAINAFKPIAIEITASGITFDEKPWGYDQPAAKAVSITASKMEGCEKITIASVAIKQNTDQFTLTDGGGDKTVTDGTANTNWTIQPKLGLEPGEYKATVAITYNCEGKQEVSKEAEVSFKVVKAARTMTELTVSHESGKAAKDGKLSGVTTEMEYKLKSASDYTAVTTAGDLTGLEPGAYCIHLKATDHYEQSADVEYTVKAFQAAALTVASTTRETETGKKDGSITMTVASDAPLEYRSMDSKVYTKVEAGQETISGLGSGIYYVRYQETDAILAGADVKAELATQSYTVTYQIEGEGKVTAIGGEGEAPKSIAAGSSEGIQFEAVPDKGYELLPENVSVTKAKMEVLQEDNQYRIYDAIDKCTVTVRFTLTEEQEQINISKEDAVASMSDAMRDDTAEEYLEYAEELKDLRDAILDDISNAETEADVNRIYAEGIKTLQDKQKEILDHYKELMATGSDAIRNDKDKEDYSSDNWKKLGELEKKAAQAIKDAKTPRALKEEIDELLLQAEGIPTIEQEDKQYQKELAQMKKELTASASDAIPHEKEEYSKGVWSQIQKLLDKFKDDIKKLKVKEAVEECWDNLVEKLGELPTIIEEVEACRSKSQATLDNTMKYVYNDQSKYTEDNWNLLLEYYQKSTEAIDEAAEAGDMDAISEMEAILKEALSSMKGVLTLADMGSEQKKDPAVVRIEDMINKLPNPATATKEQLEAARGKIAQAKRDYEALGDLKKDVDDKLVDKLDKLIVKLFAIKMTVKNSTGLSAGAEGLLGLLLSSGEIENLTDDVEVILSLMSADGTPEEKEAVNALLGAKGKASIYLDITLTKKVGGSEERITELSEPIELSVMIPSGSRGGKNYKVIRVHNGVAEELETRQEGNMLYAWTDRFSTYVIAYEPKSGSGGGGGSVFGGSRTAETEPLPGVWMLNEAGWWYKCLDGSYPANCWRQIDEQWYRFNDQGYIMTGWYQHTDMRKYYFDTDPANAGKMVTGWKQIDQKWYYFNPVSDGTKGSLVVNATTPEGYLVGADGARLQ